MNLVDATERVDEKHLKVIIIGDSLVGKSSFVESFINGKIRRTTTGVDFAFKIVKCQEQVVKLQLWDINGQLERYSPIRKLYYKDASACVIIFDVTQYKTFDSAIKWRKNVETLRNWAPYLSACIRLNQPIALRHAYCTRGVIRLGVPA
eukprot:XP_011674157.1 PREDICTED: ras-related protein Rab-7L1-like [Strongylocentrotus purpuratus]